MQNKLRFTVGETYTFCRTLFTPSELRFGSLYLPWTDTLISIEAVNLFCTKHYRVPGEWSDEICYDGFTFSDSANNPWHNQFPRAAYGQINDSQDRVVYRHFESGELLQIDDKGECLRDENGKMLIANKELWEIYTSQHDHPFSLCTEILGKVHRAIHDISLALGAKEKTALANYQIQLITKIEEVSKKKVTFEKLSYFSRDANRQIETDYLIAKLV